MPRTKQVKKKSSVMKKHSESTFVGNVSDNDGAPALLTDTYKSPEEFKKKYESYYNKKIEVREMGFQAACTHVKSMMSDMIQRIPPSVRELKLTQFVSESQFSDQNTDPNVFSVPKPRASRSRKPVDSFAFKKPITPTERSSSSLNRRTSSRKRSASAAAAVTRTETPKQEIFKTPLMSHRKMAPGSVITPKISDTPMSVMRRPLMGEMAVSMSGSPLMVGPVSREDIPTVNVPLLDGRIFSIMPESGAPPSDLPEIDETTKQYLKTLRAHLEILAPSTP